ncbi:MAG: DUF3341 domain-containing protein [Bacteroidota bacterium]
MASATQKKVLYGLYNDEEDLMAAIKKAKAAHLDIMDVYSPFPIHGLDPLLGLSESRLHIAGFVYGALGTLTAFGVMTWVFTRDWPIIFGGKPYWSVPAFIPITFELTVLFAAIGMVVSFYIVCGLGPGVTNETLDDRITDDKFCLAFDTNGASNDEVGKLQSFLKSTGAEEVNTKVL